MKFIILEIINIINKLNLILENYWKRVSNMDRTAAFVRAPQEVSEPVVLSLQRTLRGYNGWANETFT